MDMCAPFAARKGKCPWNKYVYKKYRFSTENVVRFIDCFF